MSEYRIIYDPEPRDGKVYPVGLCIGNVSFPIDERCAEYKDFLAWNAKQEYPLDLKTPVEIEKSEPDPTPAEKIAALEAMVKRLSGDTKQTTEEIDLMVKTGLITEDTAATMKAEA